MNTGERFCILAITASTWFGLPIRKPLSPSLASATMPVRVPSSGSSSSKSAPAQEAKEKAEGEHETAKEKAPPPAPKKATSKINKLSKTHGKKHQEEINALGAEPIETG